MHDTLTRGLFLAQLASTWWMVGLIWFVQIVHYPLFARVGQDQFCDYEQRHTHLTGWVVGPPMLVEAASAVLMLWFTPPGIPVWAIWTGLALLLANWLSTAFLQVPCHNALSKEFNQAIQRRLVSSNWLRTFAWSLRGLLLLWMAW
ncbi:hypothetical protein [Planctomicrobium piriforme]|uniref:DUF1772 domain-containing protein n=1 Tax=Planctomicrobium piriforme TaxID=1576369 RepID=A0A1I3SAJ8_9PLAN|nr:hypothetical protein [Planctomicrobium piriforme]SFJ55715.1 hypothetical protein SAMN05421753_12379 [Planctomicrobium piriforme]